MPVADIDIRSVIDAVSRAADHALELWAGGATQVRRWEKEPGQPVCEADLAVDAMLREELGRLAPDATWLSEETKDDAPRLDAGRLWVVDPIDGTRDYLRGRTGWAVSVALVEQGTPVLGILAAPARNETWTACAGQGARRNGRPVQASTRADLYGARIPADALPRAVADLVMVPKPNSIALRMAMVAADEADLIATLRWGNEWDLAAAALIATEAGAAVTDAIGRPLRFNRPRPLIFGVLCCAPGIQQAMLERISGRARQMMDETERG